MSEQVGKQSMCEDGKKMKGFREGFFYTATFQVFTWGKKKKKEKTKKVAVPRKARNIRGRGAVI